MIVALGPPHLTSSYHHPLIDQSIDPSIHRCTHPTKSISQSINQTIEQSINPIKQAIKYKARVCHPASSICDSMLQDSMGYHFGLFWYPRVWVTECKHCSIKRSSWVISAAAPIISCACGCRCSELPFGPARAAHRMQGRCSSCSGSFPVIYLDSPCEDTMTTNFMALVFVALCKDAATANFLPQLSVAFIMGRKYCPDSLMLPDFLGVLWWSM